ncbi:hypothetical protein BGX27_003884 [Mortierella sp. AM989]|nr:hypothetical protein BGX27_003884 [Mortierella sp. AM989]
MANNTTQLPQSSTIDIPSVLDQHHLSNFAESSQSRPTQASRISSPKTFGDGDGDGDYDLADGDSLSLDGALSETTGVDEAASSKKPASRPSKKRATKA